MLKRRSLAKTKRNSGTARNGGSSSESFARSRATAKKAAKKPGSTSAASSILGLATRNSDESVEVDHAAECRRLREQLERVLTDHDRQEEEIVALRALAKSLKEEVEAIHEQQRSRESLQQASRFESNEFFKLDVQVEQLQSENAELRRQLQASQEEIQSARKCISKKIPTYKLAAVKATAELQCVRSQLQQERAHSDRLQEQLVRFKARRDDFPARVFPNEVDNQKQDDGDGFQDAGSARVRRDREDFFRHCVAHKTTDSSDRVDDTRRACDTLPDARESFNADGCHDFIHQDFNLRRLNLSPFTSPTSSKST